MESLDFNQIQGSELGINPPELLNNQTAPSLILSGESFTIDDLLVTDNRDAQQDVKAENTLSSYEAQLSVTNTDILQSTPIIVNALAANFDSTETTNIQENLYSLKPPLKLPVKNIILNQPISLSQEIEQSDLIVTEVSAESTANLQEIITISWTVKNQGTAATINSEGWFDSIYLSNDPIYGPEDTHIANLWNALELPLEAEQSYSLTESIQLSDAELGNQYLIVVADKYSYEEYYYKDYYDYENEADENNNAYAVPITINAADLIVTTASAPTEGTISNSIEIEWTVTNQSSVTANANWYDRIYLSNNTIYDSSDLLVNYFSIDEKTPLAGGTSYTQSQTITLPKNATIGHQYLLLVTDAYSNQGETNETNNVYATEIIINAPDLKITNATSQNAGIVGSSIAVEWTVTNQSSVTANADWYDRVYLSDNTVYDSSDLLVDYFSIGEKTPLTGGTSYTQSQTIILPGNATIGRQYLLFVTDANKYQGETNETNNVYVAPITLNAPDLTITALAPIAANLSSPLSVSWTVNNQSQQKARANWYDSIYLSDDITYDSGDTWINDFQATPLEGGTSYTKTETITISDRVKSGDRYLLFVADQDKTQTETNESNNVYAVPITLNGGVDLNITTASISQTTNLTPGAKVLVNWKVTNQSPTTATADWYDYIYFSNDANYDNSDQRITYQSLREKTPLVGGASYTLSENIILPTYDAIGQRYLLFVVDHDNNQEESNETNNVYAVPISFSNSGPDLTITSVSAPQTAIINESISISWNVTNQGQAIPNKTNYSYNPYDWYDYFYWSEDPLLDNEDTYITNQGIDGSLAAQADYTRHKNITIPANSKTGNGYLLVVTDKNNNLNELNETNNVYAIPITLSAPDLIVTNLIP